MDRIINDFTDLGGLLEEMTLESASSTITTRHSELQFPDLHTYRASHEIYQTYFQAAAAAVKSFPILFSNGQSVKYSCSKKWNYIAFGKGAKKVFFHYSPGSGKKKYSAQDRKAAFAIILFFYSSVRSIPGARTKIIENTNTSQFLLSINDIPLISASYKRYSGTIGILRLLKREILRGRRNPEGLQEISAFELGEKFCTMVEEASYTEAIPNDANIDYTKVYRSEEILVSSKPGPVPRNKTSVTPNKFKLKEIPGRSIIASPKAFRPVVPWIDSWNDRHDHDD